MYLKTLSEKNAQNKCRKEKRDLMLLHKLPENDANNGITRQYMSHHLAADSNQHVLPTI